MENNIKLDRLIIPVYINEKIVLDMLAIIEDGFSMVSQINYTEHKESSSAQKVDAGISTSAPILSKFLKIDVSGGLSHEGNKGENENVIKEKVHTNVSLLSKFRGFLVENKILKYSDEFWDTSDANNYYAKGVSPYIKKSLDQLKYQGQSVGDYTAGYMWGTLGYVYNPKYVSREDAEDWGLLLNQKYYKKITAKDSVRDCYFAVRGMQTQKEILTKKFQNQSNYKERLSSLLNDTSDQSIQNAGMILSKIKDNVYSFETDSGKADLVSGKVVANLQWSGDGVYSMQQVEEEGIKLRYAVPKASTNLWFDGWCMLKSGIGKDKEKQQAAQAFVNYISRPDNVVRNMYYVGYTSVISGGEDKTIYDYIKYMYGSEDKKSVDYDLNYFFQQNGDNYNYVMKTSEEMSKGQLYAQYPTQDVMRRSAVMTYFGDQANKKISRMWIDMRCFDPRIKKNSK